MTSSRCLNNLRQALRVVSIADLACGARVAAFWSSPADTTALSPFSRAAAASDTRSGSSGVSSRSGSSGVSSASAGGCWWRWGACAAGVADRLLSRSATAPALDGDDLKVKCSEGHTQCSPGLEVVLNSNRAAGRARAADGDVLVEGGGTFD